MGRSRHAGRETAMIARCHDSQLVLCDELETIADGLPSNLDRQRCLLVARAVCPIIVSSHDVEEKLLFDALERLPNCPADLSRTLERLRYQHYEDLCFAEELQDVLLALGHGEESVSADAIGYMLRGFFESIRRHVAFERELLMPMLQLGGSPPRRNEL